MGSNRWMLPLCLASLLWAFSFGLNAPLASLWMQDALSNRVEESNRVQTLIGLNTSFYYLGIAVAACAVPWLMRRRGYRALAVGMVMSGVTCAAFPWPGDLTGWFAVRLLNGMAGALSLIPLETYINHTSSPERRAQNFGYYAFCIALGMGLGTLVGTQMYPTLPRTAFSIGGVAGLLAAVVVLIWKPEMTHALDEIHDQAPLRLSRNFLSFGSGWSQGFLEGGMVALLPIYLLAVGFSDDGMSWLMSGLMIGVILAQVPVAWLADKLGRTIVLAGCHLIALMGIGLLMIPLGTAWLAVWLFVVGACSGAFYPLGLALLGERVPPRGLARATAWYLAINCLGSLTGPMVAGWAMDQFGRDTLFITGGAAVALVLGAWLITEVGRRRVRRLRSLRRADPKQRSIKQAA
ncbi:MAG TPA: MFS transporter [Gemmataceae bacterium]|nr:MFS transporter [Gemmataceae bacterium]